MSKNSYSRRDFAKAMAVGGLIGLAPRYGLAAASYPNRDIRLIVPWTAGGSSDVVMRVVGARMSERLGVSVIVENKPGAGGTLGALELIKSAPDGYTLSQIPLGVITAPLMRPSPYDPIQDITYIANLRSYTNGLVVRADSPIKTAQQYIAYAKQNPGKATYAVAGVGTYAHLSTEEFAYRAGIELLNIPYKGDADAFHALMGGHVMSLASSSSWAASVDAGDCRLLAVYSQQRNPRWPSVPTLKELGFDTIPDSPFGIGGPKGMDPTVIGKLDITFREILQDPAVVEVLRKYDMPPRYLSSKSYLEMVEATYRNQADMVKRLGLGIG